MLHSQRASEGEKAETRPLWVERRPVPVLELSPGPITHCDVCDLMRGVVWCGRMRACVCVSVRERYVPQQQERENVVSSRGGRERQAARQAA